MIVVSDTSPLNYLVMVACGDILPALFDEVHCPPEVIAELRHSATPPVVRQWADAPPAWLRITRACVQPRTMGKFGPGELHAIAVAKELAAGRVLIDERDGTQFARQQGLIVIGTLAVLEQAASVNLVHLPTVLGELTRTTFRVPAALIRDALARDAARRGSQGDVTS